jgi:Protein of unknown function (DUF3992)
MAQLGGCSSDELGVVNDAVCVTIDLPVTTVGTPIPVWTDTSTFAINGTIVVENNGTVGISPTASLEVNGTDVTDFTVGPGEAQSITLNNIESIAIAGTGGTGTASVKVAFSLNYKF